MNPKLTGINNSIIARVTGEREQTLNAHITNVSEMARQFADKCAVGSLAEAAGLLHDLGKAAPLWQEYLRRKNPGEKIPHSIHGANYAYERAAGVLHIAEILSNIIASHHGSLYDNITPDGEAQLFCKLAEKPEFAFAGEYSIDANALNNELMYVLNKAENEDKPFFLSMLIKLLFSCLVDADRLDAYLFESGETYTPVLPDWNGFILSLEKRLSGFSDGNTLSEMANLRQKVSEDCKTAGQRDIGIYKLEVATGGGKTLSSLRFALEHAKNHKLDRVIYVIPYLSILSQTAAEIRNTLRADENTVLEHHSGFLPDDEKYYKLQTDRWDAPIILTTQVQLMESIFSARGSDLRKLHNMSRSVIIFDEAQSVPVKCIHLFNTAMNFLNKVCKSTILLCTATQPPFDAAERKIRFTQNLSLTQYIAPPKRHNLINALKPTGYTQSELAEFVMTKHKNSTLIILNTKAAAKSLFGELKQAGVYPLHLSTNMCGAHRDAVIAELRRRLKENEPVICVSTQLIEAGVDISLECVIRDIAGLDSIYQAAGRCNRSGEMDGAKDVYVINVKDENLSKLPDIKIGAEITKRLIDENNGDLDSADITQYYRYYFFARKDQMDYNTKGGSIYDLLSANRQGCGNKKNRGDKTPSALHYAIRSAADEFFVIDKGRTDVIVLYGDSTKLLDAYESCGDIKEKRLLLKQLGKYSVSLYAYQFDELRKRGALTERADITILDKGFYDDEFGVNLEGAPNFLII